MNKERVKPETISRIIEVTSLDESGARFLLEPSAAERSAIAQRLEIPAIRSLRCEFFLTPTRSGVNLVLKLDAEAERICVTSLEPLVESIREEIRISFDRNYVENENDEFSENEVLREPFEGDEIDIGEILVQHLSLSLDPYPRKKGATNLSEKFRDAALSSPFSALKGLADHES